MIPYIKVLYQNQASLHNIARYDVAKKLFAEHTAKYEERKKLR